jgi:acyl-CoA-binding protein
MNLKEQFAEAQKRVTQLKSKPNNQDLLALYSHYKQASEGDAGGDRPSGFDFVEMAKYNAWAKLKGMPMEEAMQAYVSLVEQMVQKYG